MCQEVNSGRSRIGVVVIKAMNSEIVPLAFEKNDQVISIGAQQNLIYVEGIFLLTNLLKKSELEIQVLNKYALGK